MHSVRKVRVAVRWRPRGRSMAAHRCCGASPQQCTAWFAVAATSQMVKWECPGYPGEAQPLVCRNWAWAVKGAPPAVACLGIASGVCQCQCLRRVPVQCRWLGGVRFLGSACPLSSSLPAGDI